MPLFLGEDKITRVIMSVESADGGTNTNDATLSSGAQMLKGVTAYSKGTKYTGTIATVEGPTPDISVSSDGLIAASISNPKGYQAESTTKTATQQLTTKGATTITPSSASQIAVNSGVYTTGKITVSAVPTETKKITANGTYSPSAGKYFSSVEVAIAGDTPTYQSKTISPSTSVQTVTADSGYDALSDVTVNAIQTETKSVTPTTSTQKVTPTSGKYLTEVTISAIQTETKSVTSNGTYKPTSGKYFSSVTVNVPSETFNTQTKTVTPTESTQTISPDNGYNGLSTVTVNPISSTYIGSAVPTKGATTITPNSNSQTAISSGTYATGNITVSAVPTETKSITANGTYTPSNGKYFSSVNVNVVGDAFDIQSKSVTPTESEQIVTPDAGYDGLSSVTVGAISSTYVGSDVARKSATTITPSESSQTIAANQYLTGIQTISAIPSDYIGSGVTRKSAVTITPSTSAQTAVSAGTYVTGNITVAAMESGELNTPSVNASGLVTASVKTSGYLDDTTTKTLQLNTKGSTTITPSTSSQTAISAGTYATGNITVDAIPNNYVDTSDATAAASDIIIGKSAYVNGEKVTGSMQSLDGNSNVVFSTTNEISVNGFTSDVYIGSDAVAENMYISSGGGVTITIPATRREEVFGNVKASEVLAGKTFVSNSNIDVGSGYTTMLGTGTMPSKEATTITPTTTDQTIEAGQYLSGAQTIKGDANLVSENIISGKSIFGVSGSVVIQKYYTGASDPSSSLGNDGDIYLKA